ncbi:MAG TPA: TonB-dependent receptor [Bacteroidales bacterium]|nr:TonB-dependent receptor [Bacteroidales bacterium]HSA42819.1 TonB-dependent receptor [Bacteroidales bacterium]
MKNFFLVMLMFLVPFFSEAQQVIWIQGTVIDTLSRKPVIDVQISVKGTKQVVLSDAKGKFRFQATQNEGNVLLIKHVGYESKTIEIAHPAPLNVVVELFPMVFQLGEFVVEGKVTPIANVTEIPELKIRQSSNRDVGDFLREIPNLSAVRKGGTGLDPVVRGLRFNQLNVQVDQGIRIEGGCPNRMDPTTAHVEIEDVEAMEVIKGPFVLRYGPSFGGIINISTYQPAFYENSEIHAVAMTGFESNWNGNRQHLRVNGGNKQWAFYVSGGLKNYGSYMDGEENRVQSGFLKYSFAGGLGYKPSPKESLLFNYRESHGRDVFYPALPMDEKVDNTRIMSLDYSMNHISDALQTVEAKVFYSKVFHEMDNAFRPNYSFMQAVAMVNANNFGGRLQTKWTLGETFVIAGLDIENVNKDGDRVMVMNMSMPGMPPGTMTVRTNLWYEASILNSGVFAELRRPFGKYHAECSVRADYNTAGSEDTLRIPSWFDETDSRFTNLSFSAGLSRSFAKYFSLSLALGRGVRSPSMTERYIKFLTVGYDNYDYLGNPALKPEVNNQADLTLRYRHEMYGRFYANIFASYIQDYISGILVPPAVATPKTNGAVGVKQFTNSGSAFLRGFEISYQSPAILRRIYAGIQAAYTRASIREALQYKVENGQVVSQTSLENDPLPEIPPLESTLSLSANLMKDRLFPSIAVRLVAKQDYVSGAFYEAETAGFAVFQASLHYKPMKWLSLAGGVNNMFNRQYYEHLNRRIVGSTARLYEPGRVYHLTLIANL